MNLYVLPTGSVAPNTEEKLLSETNAFAGGAATKPKRRNNANQIFRILVSEKTISYPALVLDSA